MFLPLRRQGAPSQGPPGLEMRNGSERGVSLLPVRMRELNRVTAGGVLQFQWPRGGELNLMALSRKHRLSTGWSRERLSTLSGKGKGVLSLQLLQREGRWTESGARRSTCLWFQCLDTGAERWSTSVRFCDLHQCCFLCPLISCACLILSPIFHPLHASIRYMRHYGRVENDTKSTVARKGMGRSNTQQTPKKPAPHPLCQVLSSTCLQAATFVFFSRFCHLTLPHQDQRASPRIS